MIIRQNAKVLGMKYFKDTVDGKAYDSTTIYAAVDLDNSRGQARGLGCAEYKSTTSDLFHTRKDVKFPCDCELVLDMVTNGKVTKFQLVDFTPLGAAAPQVANKAV
ncbi:hypothetical protein HNQ50_001446 [Silvimonas terrae]|uniref:Uncharacterized protein n=1 Tax=Silvimonas terrae TaxID=300266 RepID=A0A840RDR0_9NEIS|nr:hypothetical protein [Silvimonas terrae]MBB5190724.1 hypothetical protein [Silvimonas terrae]